MSVAGKETSGEVVRIGVLALQGGFAEHVAMLKSEADARKDAKIAVEEVKHPDQLPRLDGLVIPGGESTTLSVFLRQNSFEERLRSFARDGERPGCVWGTCAGLILLSDRLDSQKKGGQVTVRLSDTLLMCRLNILTPPPLAWRN